MAEASDVKLGYLPFVGEEPIESRLLVLAQPLYLLLDVINRWRGERARMCAALVYRLSDRLGFAPEERETALAAALLHDVGMAALPQDLVFKPGELALLEGRQMEKHSEIGEAVVRPLVAIEPRMDEVARAVRHHHERWDGLGYPDGLAGYAIPLLSRLLSVADAYVAMTEDAPYRDALPARVARLRLAQAAGSQFDPAIVAALEAGIVEGMLEDNPRLAWLPWLPSH